MGTVCVLLGASPIANAATKKPQQPTVRSVLQRLYLGGQIDDSTYTSDLNLFNSSLTEVKHLSSARGSELEAVIENLHNIAASGQMTVSRLPALFLTLAENKQWWANGPLLSYGQRETFPGSLLIWEFYPGQGLELQELGSFGKANFYCGAGASYASDCQQILSELIPLAAKRAGGIAWEYYFDWDGGTPPWASAMAQATALQALARASTELNDPSYLTVARQAMPVFTAPPPAGVGVKTSQGRWFLLYSFAPDAGVLNGFLQTLIGLYQYAQTSGSAAAQQLFAAGNTAAEAAVPHYDTGAWSLYQPGIEDDLSYHELVTGFLQQLCTITSAPVYCNTATNFQNDLKTPPALNLTTTRLPYNHAAHLDFTLSKISRVGVTLTVNGKTQFLTSAQFGYGKRYFAIPALKTSGTYTVVLDATDLAGNYTRDSFTLTVPPKPAGTSAATDTARRR
jgi:D-glucuronyl C5-epimerase-like protein